VLLSRIVTREKKAMNRMLFMADYSLDAQGIDSPEATLCQCSESYIVAPVSGAGARGDAGAGECCGIQDDTMHSFVLLRRRSVVTTVRRLRVSTFNRR
jgi:hypothetical protein